jgi:hypothetical protein
MATGHFEPMDGLGLLILLLMVAAVVCLFLAAFGVAARRVSLGWLGLAFWALTVLITGWPDM